MRKLNPFKPSDYTGCQLWLDGADPNGTGRQPASGTVLTSWTDKSGSGNTVTLPSLTYSLNTYTGYPGVVFTSGTASSQLTLSPYDCFFASSYTSSLFPISYPGLLGQTAVVMFGNYWQSANFMANGGGFNTNGLNTYGNYVADARNMTVSDVYSLPSSTFALRVGSGDGYPNNSWLGHIYEVIVFSNALNTRQRQQVEGYMCQKWGTVSYLPAGHPGRTGVIYPHNLLIDTLITGQPTRLPFIRSRATLQTRIFTYTGALQNFVVPTTTSSITVYMWGAGGGGYYPTQSYGGAGCYLTGILPVTGGETLSVLVGQAGTIQFPAQTGLATRFGGGGGIISTGGNANAQYNGSGGGRSAIQRSSVDIVSAGAGGGCGTQAGSGNGHNGGTGSWTGTGGNGADDKFGLGGTQTAGGASQGNGAAGIALVGGQADPWGGGGGGGFYGGGAGSDNNAFGSGGGGGSSYTGLLSNASGSNGTLNVAPATNSPYYVSGVAVGGTQALSGNGGPGLVVITYFA